jgi:hypothetical protein
MPHRISRASLPRTPRLATRTLGVLKASLLGLIRSAAPRLDWSLPPERPSLAGEFGAAWTAESFRLVSRGSPMSSTEPPAPRISPAPPPPEPHCTPLAMPEPREIRLTVYRLLNSHTGRPLPAERWETQMRQLETVARLDAEGILSVRAVAEYRDALAEVIRFLPIAEDLGLAGPRFPGDALGALPTTRRSG